MTLKTLIVDRYENYAALSRAARRNIDYQVVVIRVPDARVVVVAPHGGSIEFRTSDIARAIAGDIHSLYLFEGTMYDNNRDLHVTSHNFDEPECLQLIGQHDVVLAIHGCTGSGNAVYVGDLDDAGRQHMAHCLRKAGFDAQLDGHQFPASNPKNVCNRGARGMGIQLELSRPQRDALDVTRFAQTVRHSLATLPVP